MCTQLDVEIGESKDPTIDYFARTKLNGIPWWVRGTREDVSHWLTDIARAAHGGRQNGMDVHVVVHNDTTVTFTVDDDVAYVVSVTAEPVNA